MRTRAYNENEALQDNQIDEKRVTERADEALVEENAKKEEQASGLAEDNATVEPVGEQTDNQESNKEIGSKHMRNWNKDPGLGTDDRPRMSNDNSDNKWTQLMEEAPSFLEHMEQMESGESDVDQGNTVAEGEFLETYGEDTQSEQMSDLTEGSDEAIAEENANQEEQASDLTSEGMSNNEQVDNSQEEANDLIQKNTSGERTDENEQEEQTSDLTGAESSNESPAEEGGEETQSYGY